jgi:hypothetical protein
MIPGAEQELPEAWLLWRSSLSDSDRVDAAYVIEARVSFYGPARLRPAARRLLEQAQREQAAMIWDAIWRGEIPQPATRASIEARQHRGEQLRQALACVVTQAGTA